MIKNHFKENWNRLSKWQRTFFIILPISIAIISGLKAERASHLNQTAFIKGCKEGMLKTIKTSGNLIDQKLDTKITQYCSCSAEKLDARYTTNELEKKMSDSASQKEIQEFIQKECSNFSE